MINIVDLGFEVGGIVNTAMELGVFAFYSIIAGIFIVVLWYLLNIFTYNRQVIIKERIGEPFTYNPDTTIELEEQEAIPQESSLDRLKSVYTGLDSQKEPEEVKEKIKAIPTLTKAYRAKVVQVRGKYVLLIHRFLKKPIRMKVQGSQFWNLSGGSKRRIELIKLSDRIYAPLVTVIDKNAYMKAAKDETYVNWVIQDIEEDNRKFNKQSFWDKYGNMIAFSLTIILCMVFVVVVFKQVQPFAQAAERGAEVLANACVEVQEQAIN